MVMISRSMTSFPQFSWRAVRTGRLADRRHWVAHLALKENGKRHSRMYVLRENLGSSVGQCYAMFLFVRVVLINLGISYGQRQSLYVYIHSFSPNFSFSYVLHWLRHRTPFVCFLSSEMLFFALLISFWSHDRFHEVLLVSAILLCMCTYYLL